jgi:signal transduction histidine kinase
MTADTAVLPTLYSPVPEALPRRGWFRQLGLDTGYALAAFPLAIAAFVVVVTGLSLGAGLLVVWVGVAVLSATLVAARGLATAERAWLPAVLRTTLPRPRYLRAEGTVLRKLLTPLRDPQAWLDALHAVVRFPLAILGFVVTVTFWSLALGGLSYIAWGWSLPDPAADTDNTDLLELMGLQSTPGSRIALYTGIGLFCALLLPFLVRGVALLQAQLGRVLLTSRAATQAELGRLSEGRDAAVAAEAVALRRLERDIHDGPQQRLVRLGMDLSRAQRQLERDPEAARATLGEAAGMAREALEELRALSRGIAPPVLADRGLAAALESLALRSPLPVAVSCPERRLPEMVEVATYYLVAESLTNAIKHSRAGEVAIVVTADPQTHTVTVEVSDDGVGGADLNGGSGLRGLDDRAASLCGTLSVTSPPGGGTTIRAVLPCA